MPLCMGLKRFAQHNVDNFRCAWTEPDKQQPLAQMLLVRRQLSEWSATSIRWHLLNPSISINHSNVMSDNDCRKSGLRQLVPEANSPKNLPYWKRPPQTRLTARETCPPTSNCNFRSADPFLGQTPQPADWFIQSGSLPSWREWSIESPRMNRSGSRRNPPSGWSNVKHGGRQLAFRRFGMPSNSV